MIQHKNKELTIPSKIYYQKNKIQLKLGMHQALFDIIVIKPLYSKSYWLIKQLISQHLHIVAFGKTGDGKSSLFKNILQINLIKKKYLLLIMVHDHPHAGVAEVSLHRIPKSKITLLNCLVSKILYRFI